MKSRLVAGRLAGAMALSALVAGLSELAAQPAPGASPRIALVIGEATYKTGPLSSAANDAGLIADTLQLAGFDVTGAADLDQDGLRRSLARIRRQGRRRRAGRHGFRLSFRPRRAICRRELYRADRSDDSPRRPMCRWRRCGSATTCNLWRKCRSRRASSSLDAARINTFAQTGRTAGRRPRRWSSPTHGGLYAFNAAPDSGRAE